MSTEARNNVVTAMLDELRGMVFNFAKRFELEFEDCLQHAALVMLEVWPRLPDDCRSVPAYLRTCVRYKLYDILRARGQETLSLDKRVSPDSTQTFADMLQAFVEQETARSERMIDAVHKTLRKQSLEVQLHASEFYKLGSYKPVLPSTRRKVVYGRKKESMRQSFRRALRKDQHVLALMR
jgi:DNA-directed RNA polymerase specialized sigma24 family protein